MLSNKRTKRIAAFLVVIACLTILGGCQKVGDLLGNSGNGGTNITLVSNEIAFPIERIRTLNPVIGKDEDGYFIDKLIYQGLFELNSDLRPMPVLARQGELSDDGVTMTVFLQKNIKWSDGSTFTAEDVKYSIDAYRSATTSDLTLYGSYVQTIESCKVEDNDTVKITFRDKNLAALENLTFPIISSKQFKEIGSATKETGKTFIPVGTGPYMVISADPNKEIILEGNPNYSGNQSNNRLIFKVFPDKDIALNLFGIGTIDFTILKQADRDTLLHDKPVNVESFLSNEVEALGFNAEDPVLQDKTVRQAIAWAVDTGAILDECYYGNGIRNDTIYPPGYIGFPKEEDHYPVNLETAKSLMAAAGYTDNNEDGYLENNEGEILMMRLLVNGEDGLRNLAAQMIRANLGKLGISVTVDSLTWEAYNASLAEGSYDLYLGGFQVRDAYGVDSILKSNGGNPNDYTSEELDALLDYLMVTTGTEEKIAAFDAVRQYLLDEMPQYCLFYKTYGAVSAKTLEGEIQSTYFNIYKGCDTFTVNRTLQAE